MNQGSGRNNLSFWHKLGITMVFFGALFTVFGSVGNIFAQFVAPPVTIVADPGGALNKGIEDVMIEAASTAVLNAANYFASAVAYNLATDLTSGCPGQKSCWDSRSLANIALDSVGEFVGTINEVLSQNDPAGRALAKFGLNLCKPIGPILLQIQLGLLDKARAPIPKCTWNQVSGVLDSLDPATLLLQSRVQFRPGQAPVSALLTTGNFYADSLAQKKQNDIIDKLTRASAGGGFSEITDAISGRIKSPAAETKAVFDNYYKYKGNYSEEYARGALFSSLAGRAWQGVAVSFAQTFGQQLISFGFNKLVNGLLSTEALIAQQPNIILNEDGTLQRPSPLSPTALRFLSPTPRSAGAYDILTDMSACPDFGSTPRMPYNCLIDSGFSQAVRSADAGSVLTVQDALDQRLLNAGWPLVASANNSKDQNKFCYQSGYCESNLKKLRAARIIPVGWEIAASQSPVGKPVTLGFVVSKFNDCNPNGQADTNFPWCHLIDPNWILRVPLTQCRAQVYSPFLQNTEAATRAQTCVDQPTCLRQDEKGNCIGGYGYCTAERNTWFLGGDSCPAQYDSCRTMTDAKGQQKNYLLNTVDYGICNSGNAGCQQYALNRNVYSCSNLNASGQVATCVPTAPATTCPCTILPVQTCNVATGDRSCQLTDGSFCTNDSPCVPVAGTSVCACRTNKSCTIAAGQISCAVTAGSSTDPSDDWQALPSRFLNAQAKTCAASDDGCSGLFSLDLLKGDSLNLIRNGGFETLTDGDGNGQNDHAQYWIPFAQIPTGRNGSIVTGANAITGSNSMYLNGTIGPITGDCNLVCSNVNGCRCVAPSAGEVWKQYSCLVANGKNTCQYSERLIQSRIPIKPNTTYTVSAVFRANDGAARRAQVAGVMTLGFSNRDVTVRLDSDKVTAVKAYSSARVVGACAGGDSNGNLVLSFNMPAIPTGTAGNSDIIAACTFSINQPITNAYLEINATNSADILVDNVQLEEGTGTAFKNGYGLVNTTPVFAKIAPDYLRCTGGAGDSSICANYSMVCREQEVGCDKFTPANGDPAVPAVPTLQDSCPATCVGYDTFKQVSSQFDNEKFPVYFIPTSAKQCTRADIGCSEFTNLRNEAKEYYSTLRACQLPSDPDSVAFYSWEGSDTAGYQLKVWNLKQTQNDVAPSVPVNASASDICAVATCANASKAPCTSINSAGVCNDAYVGANCSRAQIDAGNNDCREFYDRLGNRHYRLLSQTILATGDCSLYRITVSTQVDCDRSNGSWDTQKQECVYRASGSNSNVCSASVNGCRAYNGNASANTRNSLNDTFEIALAGWTPAPGTVATLSSEAVTIGGKSLKIAANTSGAKVYKDVTAVTRRGRFYSLTFWARGTGGLDIDFENGLAKTCTLPSACVLVAGVTSCTCTDTATGLTCPITQANGTTCTIPARVSPITVPKFSYADADTATPTTNISATWKQYAIGPVQINDADYGRASQVLTIQTAGGANATDVFIDSLVLKEVSDNISVVRNSWTTPAVCDQTPAGTPSPQEMLGCRAYKDSANVVKAFKSFSQLCREQAVGCQAYSSTQNTINNPYEEAFNAVCELKNPDGSVRLCSGSSTCSCDYSYVSPLAPTKPIIAGDVCRVAVGESTCRFDFDQADYATSASAYPDRVNISADERKYLVVKSGNLCPQTSMGCKVMGAPNIAYESTCNYTVSASAPKQCIQPDGTVELLNGVPVSCIMIDTGPLSVEGCATPRNTCALAPQTCNTPGGCTCLDPLNQDATTRQSCIVLEGQKSCNISYQYGVTSRWGTAAVLDDPAQYATTLCTEPALMCSTFTTTSGPVYFKDPGNQTCSYRENVNYPFVCNLPSACAASAGNPPCTCTNGGATCQVAVGASRCTAQIKVNGWFRNTQNGAVLACYPELLKNGTNFAVAKNADATCRLPAVCQNPNGCSCTAPPSRGTLQFSLVGSNTCIVPMGGLVCGYQGWVGQCKPEADKCEEFIDPLDTSPINKKGKPYYYLNNEKLDFTSCTSGASLDEGCVLLRESNKLSLNFSAAATYGASRQQQGAAVVPLSCVGQTTGACANRCYTIDNGTCNLSGQACSQNEQCLPFSLNGAPVANQVCIGDGQYGFTCTQNSECNASRGEQCRPYKTCGQVPGGRLCASPAQCADNCDTRTNRCTISGQTCSITNNVDSCIGVVSGQCLPVSNTDDSNVVLKVRRDRECSEWLSCESEESVFDPTTNKWRGVCTSVGLCEEYSSTDNNFECSRWKFPAKQILNSASYVNRDVTYRGEDLAGYSIPGKYPVQYLTPIDTIPGRCMTLNSNQPIYNDPSNPNNINNSANDFRYCGSNNPSICGANAYCSRPLTGKCTNPNGATPRSFCENNTDCYTATCNLLCSDGSVCTDLGTPCGPAAQQWKCGQGVNQITNQALSGVGICSNSGGAATQCTKSSDCANNSTIFCQQGNVGVKFGVAVSTCQDRRTLVCSIGLASCTSYGTTCGANSAGVCRYNGSANACADDSQCPARESCKTVTCQNNTICQKQNPTSSCFDGKCVVSFDGGALTTTDVNGSSCRGYPESDAPYSGTVVSQAGTTNTDYDQYGNAVNRAAAFGGANVCVKGSWCECSYQKATYGQSQSTTRFQSYLNATPPSTGPLSIYAGVCVGGPYDGKSCAPNSSANNPVTGRPLAVSATTNECESFDAQNNPSGNPGVCTPLSRISYAVGWEGLCVDSDPSISINNSKQPSCNLWLPVDRLPGTFDNWNQNREAGFNGPPTQPLLYCQVAEGNNRPVGTTQPYEVVLNNEQGISPPGKSSGICEREITSVGCLAITNTTSPNPSPSTPAYVIDNTAPACAWRAYTVTNPIRQRTNIEGVCFPNIVIKNTQTNAVSRPYGSCEQIYTDIAPTNCSPDGLGSSSPCFMNFVAWFDQNGFQSCDGNISGTSGASSEITSWFFVSSWDASDRAGFRTGVSPASIINSPPTIENFSGPAYMVGEDANARLQIDTSVRRYNIYQHQLAGIRIDFLTGPKRYMYLYPSASSSNDNWTNAHYWYDRGPGVVSDDCGNNPSNKPEDCVGANSKTGAIIGENPGNNTRGCMRLFTATDDVSLDYMCGDDNGRLSTTLGTDNCLAVKAVFDPQGKLSAVATVMCHNAKRSSHFAPIKATALLRENCEEVTKTHDNNNTLAGSVALTDRLLSSGSQTSQRPINNYITFPAITTEPNKVASGKTSITPYGNPVDLIVSPDQSFDPLNLPNLNNPFPIFSSEGGSFFTQLEIVKESSQPVYCQNANADASLTECSCVISGRKLNPNNPTNCSRYNYKYNDGQPDQVASLAIASTDWGIAGIPFACAGNCGTSVVAGAKNKLNRATEYGEEQLNNIFAVAWNVFRWDTSTGVQKPYINKQNTNNNPLVRNGDGSSGTPPGSGWDDRVTIMGAGAVGVAKQPTVLQVDTRNCKGAQGTCREGRQNNLTVNGQQSGPVVGLDGRLRVNIQYYAYGNKDQMPIRRKVVDFGDGRPVVVSSGFFKNRRGTVIAPATAQNAGQEVSQCDGSTWGKTTQSCDNVYFQESTTYLCSQARVLALPACDNKTYPCSRGSSCVFKPRVQLLDNWQSCNGTCPSGPNGLCVDTDFLPSSFSSLTNTNARQTCYFDETTPFDARNRPWTAYSDEIIVTPPSFRQ